MPTMPTMPTRKHDAKPLTLLLGLTLCASPGCLLDTPTPLFDADQDGVSTAADCDDTDPAVGAAYRDADGDGHGSGDPRAGCADPGGPFVPAGDDCNDDDPAVHPGADETCNGIDDDCDGAIDETFARIEVYEDNDGDGHGSADAPSTACGAFDGYSVSGTDCDDTDPTVHPGQKEICDLADNDCDGAIDEAWPKRAYAPDRDGDGYGDMNDITWACMPPGDHLIQDGSDCDDADPATYPGADEICDGIDNDCDRRSDEFLATTLWYPDLDGDGHGSGSPVEACGQPGGYTTSSGDCDDQDPTRYPGADEQCNGADDDCDGTIDNGLEVHDFYQDADGDGHGDPSAVVQACAPPAGYVDPADDCDDTHADRFPGNPERCDGIDNDCNLEIDDGYPDHTVYRDADGDGHGDPSASLQACVPPDGYVDDNLDCDDDDAGIHPGGFDALGDDTDADCDGSLGIITLVAGGGSIDISSSPVPAEEVALGAPEGVAEDAGGTLYIADSEHSVVIAVDSSGNAWIVAGLPGRFGFDGDGSPATQTVLNGPFDVLIDQEGAIIVCDTFNHRIRRVDQDGNMTTIAGTGVSGGEGDGGPAAEADLNQPRGIALDTDGRLYIADTYNHRIRRIDLDGTIHTIAGSGTPGYSGDGEDATLAALDTPFGIAIDPQGALWIADTHNHAIRRVDPETATIDTVAGSGRAGHAGDGGPAIDARLDTPEAVAPGAGGVVYLADSGNAVIRMITWEGTIVTVAGTGTPGTDGDGGPPQEAHLDYPSGLWLEPSGTLTFTDTLGARVRRIDP